MGSLGRELAAVGVHPRLPGRAHPWSPGAASGEERGAVGTDCGLLVANLSHRFVEDTEWDYSEFCAYDLGQAVAHMPFQAQSLGLYMRQFRAFDRAGLAAEFEVPQHWEVTTMSAIGYVPPDAARDATAKVLNLPVIADR